MANSPHSDSETTLLFEQILIEGAWERDVTVEIAADGTITSVSSPGVTPGGNTAIRGWTVPGLANIHSHAFQRALVGLAEQSGHDSFWSWREVMYDFLLRLSPEDVENVAAQLYMELLKGGFTCVGEFHYLQHQPNGRPYEDAGELSRRIISAADRVGIALVHIPVVYQTGGFDGRPLAGGQRRFRLDVEDAATLVEDLTRDGSVGGNVSVGWGVHSLRACTAEDLRSTATSFASLPRLPVHIHVAEQEREVEECVAARGARPIEWLLDNADVDTRWCLIHGTHGTAEELSRVANRRATIGLCPTTEANLGDGVFPFPGYLSSDGVFGVGTDSHVGRRAAEELRVLEYGQRLHLRQRGITTPRTGHVDTAGTGGALFSRALVGGAQALGRACGAVQPGMRADLVVLDGDHPSLLAREGPEVLDSWIFSGGGNPVKDVMVGGRWAVRDGHHPEEERIQGEFGRTLKALMNRL